MIYAIGDIHGQQTMLLALLEKLARQPVRDDDLLVFLGDYIDRGENPRAVIETLLELREHHPNTVFLRGNHEQMMLDAREEAPPEPPPSRRYRPQSERVLAWLMNGGGETLRSYAVGSSPNWWKAIPEAHWEFIQATRMEYIVGRYHFVHAGLVPPGYGCRWKAEFGEIDPRLWIREPFLSSSASFGGRVVIFGHSPQHSGRPLIRANKIGLDTAAVYGGSLTAAVFDPDSKEADPLSPRFLQVPYARADTGQ